MLMYVQSCTIIYLLCVFFVLLLWNGIDRSSFIISYRLTRVADHVESCDWVPKMTRGRKPTTMTTTLPSGLVV
jgi:hypothetical protein